MGELRTFGDVLPVARWFRHRLVGDYDWTGEAFAEIVASRVNAIHVIYHGAPFSWVVPQLLAVLEFTRLGGADRRPFGVFHRIFFQVPGMVRLARTFANAEPVLGFEHLAAILSSGRYNDIGIYPEGDNSLYADGRTIQPFKSSRFIELALRTDFALCLTVYSGAEEHLLNVTLPPAVLRACGHLPVYSPERLVELGHFAIPILRKVPYMSFRSVLYRPPLRLADLPEHPAERKFVLDAEGKRVRSKMQQMLDQMYASARRARAPSAERGAPSHPA